MEDTAFHFFTDETGQEILEAINNLVKAQGGSVTDEGIATEYGVRWVTGASSSALERVIRKDGVISAWDSASFSRNIGSDIKENIFDYIDLFSPELWTDAAGNRFRRFKRFYHGTEQIGTYSYHWVCKKKMAACYVLPRAFCRNGKPYWNFVDIGVYEGGNETIDNVTYLCSKPGYYPTHNITRTSSFNNAKAWHTKLGADTTKEYYCISTMSEICEILQPLIMVMTASRNSDVAYEGNTSSYAESTAITAYNTTDKKIVMTTSSKWYVGQCITPGTSTSEGDYRTIVEVGDDYIIHDGEAWSSTPTTISIRPLKSGQTDVINATHGTLANDSYHSFKMLGIENIWANIWKHILDCTIKDYVPYVCENLENWTDTSTPEANVSFKPCSYKVSTWSGTYTKALGTDQAYPDIVLPIEGGASTSTYYCDYYWVASGARTVLYGGRLDGGSTCGFFCWSLDGDVGNSYWNSGARLSHRAL